MPKKKNKDQFVHLHVHSDFSKLDGMAKVEDIVEAAAADGNPAVALTDHGSMGGIVHLAKAAKNHGINAIPGLEAYHAKDMSVKGKEAGQKTNHHLILLAQTTQGYRNLMKISSKAWLDGFYYNPRVDNDLLAANSEGIIATTSCLGSMVNQALLQGDFKKAKKLAGELKDIFGPERFFIEVQNHGIKDQIRILRDQVKLAKTLGVSLVAGTDSHYMEQQDAHLHDIYLGIATGKSIDDESKFTFSSDQNYLMTASEMRRLFPEDEFPGACDNTLLIAEMASDVHVPVNEGYLLPEFPVDKKHDNVADMLRSQTYDFASKSDRYGNEDGVIPNSVKERLDYELSVIEEMGFPSYFLMLSDAIRYAHRVGIEIGPGRGSAAGSAVAFVNYITDVDPIEHGLYFERFLNPGRRSMPDIDIDIEPTRRDEIQRYMCKKYGEDHVSLIGTYGTLKARQSLKDVSKVLTGTSKIGASLTRLYPADISQVEIPLPFALERDKGNVPKDFQRQWRDADDFRKMAFGSRKNKEIAEAAADLTGYHKNLGIHAGGLLVTPTPLWDHSPVRWSSEKNFIVSEYDLKDSEAVGCLKIDFLGLSNLGIMKDCVRLIQSDLNERIQLNRIPLDDPAVYKMLCRGDSTEVFQLSSPGMKELMIRLQPKQFSDISALIALYRPGPMKSDAHNEYADRRNGRKKIEAAHPEMLDILEETAGLPIYQEQVMALSQHFAGYNAEQADNFRKAMGKKDADVMEGEHQTFVDGVVNNGYTKELASQLWNLIEPFSGYAFNKSHSVSYGYISYRTAWLKAHYPAQFAAALVMNASEIPRAIGQARKAGVQVYSCDINRSGAGPTTSKDSMWMGLMGIKQCGGSAIEKIVSERDANGPFTSLGNFLSRVSVSSLVVTNLIHAGAFDSLHKSRKAMIDMLPTIIDESKAFKNAKEQDLGMNLFDIDDEILPDIESYDLDSPADYPHQERLSYELEAIGFVVGKHPFTEIQPIIDDLKSSGTIPKDSVAPNDESTKDVDEFATVYGIITGITVKKGRNGNPRTNFTLETGHDSSIDVVIFGRELPKSMAGRFGVASGRLKENDYNLDDEGNPNIELLASELETPRLQSSSGRGRLRSIPGGQAKPVRKKEEVEEVVQEVIEEKPEKVIEAIFHAGSTSDVQALRTLLVELGKGDVPVSIVYGGEVIKHESLVFDIVKDDVERIAGEIGIKHQVKMG